MLKKKILIGLIVLDALFILFQCFVYSERVLQLFAFLTLLFLIVELRAVKEEEKTASEDQPDAQKKKKEQWVRYVLYLAALLILLGKHASQYERADLPEEFAYLEKGLYTELATRSGAMNGDLKEVLEGIHGESYPRKLLQETVYEGHTVQIFESLEYRFFPVEKKDGVYVDCLVLISRFAEVNGDDTVYHATGHAYRYQGFDDGDLDSVVRASVDPSTKEESYTVSAEYFNSLSAQVEDAYAAYCKAVQK